MISGSTLTISNSYPDIPLKGNPISGLGKIVNKNRKDVFRSLLRSLVAVKAGEQIYSEISKQHRR
ncbi:MAG: hypothetical protein KGY38_00670, partial [Desulfobacterales bacterium]|nr:hypothetical protein [Desulfobacterales bacterium]